MELKRFTGIQEAEKLLDRSDPLDMGALPSSVLSRTESVFGKGSTPEESVMVMLQDTGLTGEMIWMYGFLIQQKHLSHQMMMVVTVQI